MDYQAYLEWKKKKKKKPYNVEDNEIMQNTDFIFAVDRKGKRKKGFTLWG